MRNCVFAVIPLLVHSLAFAQNSTPPTPPTNAGLKVSDVQEMLQSGLSEDLVIATLRKEKHAFDLSPQQMVQLKKASVSDNIIKVMLDPTAPVAPPVATSVPGVVGI